MADRSVIVRLQAEISGFKKGMADATRAAQETASTASRGFTSTGSALGNLIQTSQQFPESWNKVAGVATKAGLAITAGVGLAVKAAMDWESAWTGVKKTVEGSPEQLARVEDGLRGLARSLPASHQQIAAVAEAAGQLGVKTDDVVAFTKTMIDMGESTNMSAEEAATGIARFTNVMGSVDKYGSAAFNKVASAIVGLGNNFATTEREILAMGQRLSAAGRSAGMTEGDVLGLAAAMSSVGIEAEAGGTAMTMVMNKVARAVDGGGSSLDAFAKRSGMSAEQFAEQWKKNPSQALNGLISGLGRAQGQGESMVQMLDELGIRGVREANTIRSLASASDLLSSALQRGNKDLDEGTAAIEEAGKRYSTTGSQVRMAWNAIKDGAIDVGAALLPAVRVITESVAGTAKAFVDLPDPVKGSIGVLGAFAGAGLLVVGGGMKLISTISETKAAFDSLRSAGVKIPGSLGSIAKSAGIAAGAIAGLAILGQVLTQRSSVNANDLAVALAKVANTSQGLAGLDPPFRDWDRMVFQTSQGINGVEEAISSLKRVDGTLGQGINEFGEALFGWTGAAKSEVSQVKDRFKQLGSVMGDMVTQGQAGEAAASFSKLAEAFQKNGKSAQDALGYLPAYRTALEDVAKAAGVTLDEQELLDLAMGKIPQKLVDAAKASEGTSKALDNMGQSAITAAGFVDKETKAALQKMGLSAQGAIVDLGNFIGKLAEMSGTVLSARDAIRSQMDAQDAFTQALARNGATMDINTKAGRENQAAFDAVAQAGWKTAQAMAGATDANGNLIYTQQDLQTKLNENYEQLVGNAKAMGFNAGQADALARKVMGIPDDVDIKTWMSDKAKRMAEQTTTAIQSMPDKNVEVRANTNPFWDAIGNIVGRTFKAFVDVVGGGERKAKGGHIGYLAGGGHIGYLAGGGAISGPGTGTTDKAGLFALSNGEHVLTASDVNKLGGQRAVYSLRRDIQSGKINVAVNQPRYVPATAPRMSGEFTGNLFLDSGEFLGKVRGITQAEISRNNRLLREPV